MALKKSDSTPAALLKLADIFRYVLQEKSEMVTLEKEMDHVKHLISFEKIRFPDSVINFQCELEPANKWLQVPPLMLTAYVENAFKHGDPGTEERPVSIHLKIVNNKLFYSVINPVGTSHTEPEVESGIGLVNLGKRMSILYGSRCLMECESMGEFYSAKLEIDLTNDYRNSH
jgi:LytS/YehU family sensor histidine kinase